MRIVVPVKVQDGLDSVVSLIDEASGFAFLDLGEGMSVETLSFKNSFENELFDYIIVCDKNEELEEAFDLGARALLARPGMNLDEIVEALMFRELDEIL